jgi:hypothetical protein
MGRYSYLLVVIDQVDIKGIAILETESDAPVARNRHAPVASSVTPEPVKTIPGQIEITGYSRTIQMSQNALDASQLVGSNPTAVALVVEALQATVPKPLNHG